MHCSLGTSVVTAKDALLLCNLMPGGVRVCYNISIPRRGGAWHQCVVLSKGGDTLIS